jgi:hypothetical protein
MKKIFTLVFFVMTGMSVMAQGSAGQGSLIVKATPVTVLRNMWFTVHGEYAISSSVSLGLGISPNMVPKGKGLDEAFDDDSFSYIVDLDESKAGLSFDPEFRWYSDNMMDGFFVGAYSSLRFSGAVLTDEGSMGYWTFDWNTGEDVYVEGTADKKVDLKTLVTVLGPQFGWEKLLGKQDRFVFDGYIGVGVKLTNRQYSGPNASDFESGMVPGIATRGNVSIGYRIK